MPVTIEAIDEQFIVVGTKDYVLEIDVYGDPDSAEVDGLQEGFYQDWDADNDKIFIKSEEVTRLISMAEWTVIARKAGEPDVTATIVYSVVPAAPIFTDPGAQTIYKGLSFSLNIDVANQPSVLRAESPLVALKFEPSANEDGDAILKTAGTLPRTTRLAFTTFDMEGYAENEGGSDTLTVPFTIEDARPFVSALDRTNNRIKVFLDPTSNYIQIGGDILLGTGTWNDIAMSDTFVAAVDSANDIAKVFDLTNRNMQVGNDISISRSAFKVVMSGSLVAVLSNITDIIQVFDINNNLAQVGGDILLRTGTWNDIAMSGSLVAAIDNNADVIKVFDTDNNNAQVGGNIELGAGNWLVIAMSGSLVATILNRSVTRTDTIKVYDTSNNNSQVGNDISIATGFWADIAMSGSLVAAIDIAQNGRVRIYDTSNNNSQVGGNISLGAGDWDDVAMFESYVSAVDNTADVIKVFDTDDSNAQAGSDISLGSGNWVNIAMPT